MVQSQRLLALACLAVALPSRMAAQAYWTHSVTETNLGYSPSGNLRDIQVRVQIQGAIARWDVMQLHLFLANANTAVHFDCHVIAGFGRANLYLADDVGDWGPNERDRYVDEKYLYPIVEDLGGNGWVRTQQDVNLLQSQQKMPADWPNNSQCTVLVAGSWFRFQGETAIVNYRVLFKPHTWGRFHVSVSSYAMVPDSLNPGAKKAAWSSFDSFPPFTVQQPVSQGGQGNRIPQMLATGFDSNGAVSNFKVTTGIGQRETFYFRIQELDGVQQFYYVFFRFGLTPDDPNACALVAYPTTFGLTVVNGPSGDDTRSIFWPDPRAPVQSAACRVYHQTSKIQYLSPTEALLRLDIEFLGGNGSRTVFAKAYDDGGIWPSWSNLGTFVVQATPAGALTLADFRTCAATGAASECVLQNGVHYIGNASDKIVVRRGNVTLRGQTKHGAVLKRASPAMTEPLLIFASDVPAMQNVTIQDLTFDGSRIGNEPLHYQGPTGEIGVINVNGAAIRNCIIMNSPGNAIALQPPLEFDSIVGKLTRNITIHYNEFRRNLFAPIHIAVGGKWHATQMPAFASACPVGNRDLVGVCDPGFNVGPNSNPPGTAACHLSYSGLPPETPQNVVIANNFFEENDTGAFGFNQALNITVTNNAMLDNYNVGQDCGGGVIAAQSCTRKLYIRDNFVWNGNVRDEPSICSGDNRPSTGTDRYAKAPGVELWALESEVTGNRFEYISDSGIEANAVNNLKVLNNYFRNTSRGIQQRYAVQYSRTIPDVLDLREPFENDSAAIIVSTCEGNPKSERPVGTIEIAANAFENKGTIYAGHGIRFNRDRCGGGVPANKTIPGVSITSNSFLGMRLGRACQLQALSFPGLIAPGLLGSTSQSITSCQDPDTNLPGGEQSGFERLGFSNGLGLCGSSGCPY